MIMDRNSYYNCFDNQGFYQRSLPLALWVSIASTIRIWWATQQLKSEIMREREELGELPDYLLRDIGIDRAAAVEESTRTADDLPLSRVSGLYSRR